MDEKGFTSKSLIELEASGFDAMAQVEAFLRYFREVQCHVAALKTCPVISQQIEALHSVQTKAAATRATTR